MPRSYVERATWSELGNSLQTQKRVFQKERTRRMDELTQKISEFLLTNPKSSAREIGKEIGFSKNEVNRCLYANEGNNFSKEGLTPPLWMNTGDSSVTERAESELSAPDEDESNEDLEVKNEEQEEDWTRLNTEDQQEYLVIETRIALGGKISKEDRRRMNQLVEKIRQAETREYRLVKKQEYRAKNRVEYAAKVDEKVNEIWNVDEQCSHAIGALTRQFESYLRKLAYGYSNLKKETASDGETESDREIRLSGSRELIETVSLNLESRLRDLENMSDENLLISSVRFGWLNREFVSSRNSETPSAIFFDFEEIDTVQKYRLRFLQIVHRIDKLRIR